MRGRAKRRSWLARLADEYQSQGRYLITGDELASTEASPSAVTAAAQRLVRAGRLAKVGHRRGLWLIVPLEYQAVGAPPASWVLDDIMRALGVSYYVALRSAADLYGATHYAMQVLQVIVDRRLAPLRIGRERIRFVLRADGALVPTTLVPGQVSALRVSTPEATVLDLMRYMNVAGGLSSVATALLQMRDRLSNTAWRAVLDAMDDVPNTQRAGYLLAAIGDHAGADACRRWLAARPHRLVPLEHGPHASPVRGAPIDSTWKLALNAVPDLTL